MLTRGFAGINVLVYYSTVILGNVGLSPFMQQLVAAITNTVFAIGTCFTVFTIEPWGRRRLMFWTAVGCTHSSQGVPYQYLKTVTMK